MNLLGGQMAAPPAAVDRDLEQVLLGLADGSYVLSTPDGAVAESGIGVAGLLGAPADALVGRPIADVLVAGADDATRTLFDQVLRAPTSDPSIHHTFPARSADGATRKLQFVVVSVPLALGWEFTSLLTELRSRDATWHPQELRLRHSRALEAVEGVVVQGTQPDPGARLAGILIVVRDVDAPPLTHGDVERRMSEQRAAARDAAAEAARRLDEAAGRLNADGDEEPADPADHAPGLEDLVERARVLRERVEDAERDAAAAAQERDEALVRLAETEAERDAAVAAMQDAEGRSQQLAGERDQARQRLEATGHELHAARQEAETARAAATTAQTELAGARAQAGAARADVEAARAELESARDELGALRAQAASVGGSAASAQADAEAARADADAARDEAASARAEAQAARAEAQSAQADSERLRAELAATREAVHDERAAHSESAGAELAALRAEAEAAHTEAEAVRAELTGARAELGVVRGESALARGEASAVRAQLQSTHHDLHGAREEIDAVRAELQERNDALQAAREYIDDHDAQLADAAAQLEGAQATLGDMRAEVEGTRAELEATLAAAEDVRAEREQARLRAQQLMDEAEQARAAAEAIRAEFAFDPIDERQEPGRPPARRTPWSVPAPTPPAATAPAAAEAKPDLPPVGPGEAAALIAFDGSFKRLDDAFCSLLGCREEDLRAARWPSIIDRDNHKAHGELARALKAGEIQSAEVETVYMHAQGLLVPIAGTVSVHRAQAGGPPTHFLFRADVSRTAGVPG